MSRLAVLARRFFGLLLNPTFSSNGLNVRSAWQYLHSPIIVVPGAPRTQWCARVGESSQKLPSTFVRVSSFVVIVQSSVSFDAKRPSGDAGGQIRIRGGDGGESNSPSKRRQAQMYYRLIRRFLSGGPSTGGLPERFAASLRRPLAASGTQHPNYIARTVTAGAGHRGVVALLTQPGRVRCRQLVVCRLIREWAANSACNPTQLIPCRNHASPMSSLYHKLASMGSTP